MVLERDDDNSKEHGRGGAAGSAAARAAGLGVLPVQWHRVLEGAPVPTFLIDMAPSSSQRASSSSASSQRGAACTLSLETVLEIVRTLSAGLRVPVSVKIRLLGDREATVDYARRIVAAGASVNKARDNRTSPLRVCCQNGHVDCAKALIVAGANVNQAGESGGTPLHTACQVRRAPAALAAPSSVNRTSRTSLTPLASSPSLSAARTRQHPRPPPRRRR